MDFTAACCTKPCTAASAAIAPRSDILRIIAFLTLALLLTAALGGCSTVPDTMEGQKALQEDCATVLSRVQRIDPTLMQTMRASKGYAIFPSVGKGGIGIGGAYGRGILYEKGRPTGFCDLTQGSIGLQFGGQSYTEIIVFNTNMAVIHFKDSSFNLDVQASAVAIHAGSGADAKWARGVAVFTMDPHGLMFEASIGGQQFTYQPFEP